MLEQAFGHADAVAGVALTPRHRFRVASHSKSFTAAGIMKLREQGKLQLDDPVGRHVKRLHPAVAQATIAQLLSHSAGLIRDGTDAGQWQDRRPFLNARELRAALRAARRCSMPIRRFKYSNHGYGLAGLVIEAVTGEPYADWIKRAIVAPAGLRETEPDVPLGPRVPMARGHSAKLPLGRRVIIPGLNPTRALAPATGFVSTARDLARFFAQLDPAAKRSVLSAASRREMIRRHWRDPHATLEGYYGLGIISGKTGDWECFGHSGGFQGFITRTAVLPERDLTVSVLTNAVDGLAASLARRHHAHPAGLRPPRRAGRPDRATGAAAGGACGAPSISCRWARRCWSPARSRQSVHGRERAFAIGPRPRPHRPRQRLRQPRRNRAPRARPRRRRYGSLARRHPLPAGECDRRGARGAL